MNYRYTVSLTRATWVRCDGFANDCGDAVADDRFDYVDDVYDDDGDDDNGGGDDDDVGDDYCYGDGDAGDNDNLPPSVDVDDDDADHDNRDYNTGLDTVLVYLLSSRYRTFVPNA